MSTVDRLAEASAFQGGIGLADMAMRLAEARCSWETIGFWTTHRIEPCSRENLNPAIHPVSLNYYRIIDRIARGEKP